MVTGEVCWDKNLSPPGGAGTHLAVAAHVLEGLMPMSWSAHSWLFSQWELSQFGVGVRATARDAQEVALRVFLASLRCSLQDFLQLHDAQEWYYYLSLKSSFKGSPLISTQAYEAFLVQPSISHGDYFIATMRYSRQAHSSSACHAEIGEPNRLGSAISKYRLLRASFQKTHPWDDHPWPSQSVL